MVKHGTAPPEKTAGAQAVSVLIWVFGGGALHMRLAPTAPGRPGTCHTIPKDDIPMPQREAQAVL